MEINSKVYWDDRFSTDWASNMGRQQSTFFSRIAVEAFPEWLVLHIQQKKSIIGDWGCALGDGTQYLRLNFPSSPITGIDFSDTAINDAKENYPDINFICENFLEKDGVKEFDIIFSSNTIEHFDQPWDTLLKLSTYATEHLVILIPYKEQNRYSEHRYTFDETNIPSRIGGLFLLTHVKIINGADYQPNFWGELQILLVYSSISEINQQQLKVVSDTEIRIVEVTYQQNETNKIMREIKDSIFMKLEGLQSDFKNTASLPVLQLTDREKNIERLQKEIEQQNEAIKKLQETKNSIFLKLEDLRADLKNNIGSPEVEEQKDQQEYLTKLQKDIAWYKATYEERSLWGLLKQRIGKILSKK